VLLAHEYLGLRLGMPRWYRSHSAGALSMPNDAEPVNPFTLAILDPVHVGVTTYDAKDPDTFFPPVQPVRPPAGAPNVLLILLDDVGFGAFGGPCRTPATERLAAGAGQLDRTTPLIFSYDETTDVGRDSGSGVSEDYAADDNAFRASSTGSRSRPARRTTGTSYRPRTDGGSPWPASDRRSALYGRWLRAYLPGLVPRSWMKCRLRCDWS
jgi:hypothetical protein